MQSENAQFPMLVDAIADRDVGQPPAIVERIVPDADDAVGERDAGQPGAIERIVPDAGDAIGIVTLLRPMHS